MAHCQYFIMIFGLSRIELKDPQVLSINFETHFCGVFAAIESMPCMAFDAQKIFWPKLLFEKCNESNF